MPHRDDHEAARARVDALERELAETKARAAREVAEARSRATQAERALRGRGRDPSASDARGEGPDPRWPSSSRRGYLRSVVGLVLVVDLLVVLRFILWPLDERAPERVLAAQCLGWTVGSAVLLLPACYVLARIHRAPHPGSVFGVGLIAMNFGAIGLFASSGLGWPAAIAAPPVRWILQVVVGFLTMGIHAAALSRWTAEGVLTEDTSSD
jgi:hypothetical protein